MSKKFSTLMASLLLASAFSVNAEEAVKDTLIVDPAKGLLTGEYLIMFGNDSVVSTHETVDDSPYGNLLLKKLTNASSTLKIEAVEGGYKLFRAGTKGVYHYGSKFVSNVTEKNDIFSISADGTITAVKTAAGIDVPNGKLMVKNDRESDSDIYDETAGEQIAKFTFKLITDKVVPADVTTEELKAGRTLFLTVGGKFVKAVATLRATADGTSIALADGVTEGEADLYTWVYATEGGVSGFKSIVTGQWLTLDEDGKLAASDDPVAADITGNLLTIGGTTVDVAYATASSEALPFVPAEGLTAEEYLADGAYYILTANGKVINSENELANYVDAGHTAQVYQAKVVKLGTNSYVVRFANKETGDLLEVADQYVQVAVNKITEGENKGKYQIVGGSSFILETPNGDMVTAELEGTDAINQAILFGAAAVQDRLVTLSELKDVYGASFGVTVKRATGEKALVNNPFTGKLAPVTSVKVQSGVYLTAPDGTYMLQKENGNLIAVSPTKYANRTDATYGYKVVEITPRELYLALNSTPKQSYAYRFQLYAPGSTFVGEDAAASYILAEDDNTTATTYRLGALTVDGVGIAMSAEQGTVHNYTDALQIKLGTFTKIDLTELLAKPSFYQVTVVNKTKHGYGDDMYGTVLGLNANGNTDYVKASEALVGYPETQWAIQPSVDASKITFINRENKDDEYNLNVDEIYTTDKENVFSILSYGTHRDTIEIKPVATAETDGYLHLATSEWKNNLYYVGVNSSVWKGLAYVTENHKNEHKLGLDIDKENATAWKLTAPWIYEKNALGEVTDNYQETVDINHTLWYWSAKKNTFINTDDEDGNPTVTLTIPVYNFMNSANGEYMGHNGSAMVVDEDWDDEDYYALKETAEGKYNLVRYTRKYENVGGYYVPTVLQAADYKIYGGDSADKGILNLTGMYKQTENDIFSIEVAEAPEYVKLNYGDKIKIYRDEQESNVLYEKGEFAGIGNAVEFANINPALYVDTAWMNRDEVVNRYDYLLAVNAKQATKAYECNVPEHKHLYHYTDTTYGRFLVNLADSAIVEDERDSHNNKFVYEASTWNRYAKLGFVEAKHTGDKLIIASPKDTIEVGTPAYNLVKFAFRTVDPEAGTFVIETGYKNPYKNEELSEDPGYLRWINGNLVVTNEIGDAEVFSLKATENEATANDAISAEAGVQVISGKGAVTVQGAAGKVITVANILGQTIANQVAASDNVTIAAPAGVVVVAVDGDATKVVVK